MKKIALRLIPLIIAVICLHSCKKDEETTPKTQSTDNKETTFIEKEIKNDDGEIVEKTITIKDFGKGIGSIILKKEYTYILDGLVFVNNNQNLNIEAGTIIKGKSGQERDASALIVARGGKIFAEGTSTNPIIFCSESDNTHYDHIKKQIIQGTNIPYNSRGLWGGIIILGKGKTNNATTEKSIEGIPTEESRGKYGGNNDNDNSGIIKYVSIRNGGTDIGQGNEINGLTMGAVGSKTIIDYVEVIGNKDDGFEWFGGTVNCKHLISAYNGDDSYDYDESFRGYGQFWIAIQGENIGERIGEHDGAPKDNRLGKPYAIPHIYNVTYIGGGNDSDLILFRDNAGGFYHNSIFMNKNSGIKIEWIKDNPCSYQMFEEGNLAFSNNIFWNVANNDKAKIFAISNKSKTEATPEIIKQKWANSFEANNNKIKNPGINISINNLDLKPNNQVTTNLNTFPEIITPTNYAGAIDPNKDNWYTGWSKLSHLK
ncbi:MAG: hypothetical protein ACEPOW_06875 [Bacteroidales bacterium]